MRFDEARMTGEMPTIPTVSLDETPISCTRSSFEESASALAAREGVQVASAIDVSTTFLGSSRKHGVRGSPGDSSGLWQQKHPAEPSRWRSMQATSGPGVVSLTAV